MLGYQPFGVEYSPVGAQTARETFDQAGFDTNSVFQTDFFDRRFQNEHQGRYDVVLSRGFIEHFDNVQEVIRSHVDTIAPGGYLVCTIPNLLGWGYPYLVLFERTMLRAHNCGIMRRRVYRQLFEGIGLEQRFCNYIGMFQIFTAFERHDKSFRALIARAASRVESLIDHAMLLGLRGRAIETPWSSSLVYIGRKVMEDG